MNSMALQSSVAQWELTQRQCRAFLESGFLPTHIKSVAQAITIAYKGQELGIPPLTAFSSITVIGGKPCLSAELMLALIYSRCKGAKVTFSTPTEQQHIECTVIMKRPDGDPQSFRFSIEDAQRADIYRNAWKKYPSALLRARAISAGARAVFPDCIMGCYTPEEMGHEPEIEDAVVESVPIVAEEKISIPKANEGMIVTSGQVTQLQILAKKHGWLRDDIYNYMIDKLGADPETVSSKNLTYPQHQSLLQYIEAFPKEKK